MIRNLFSITYLNFRSVPMVTKLVAGACVAVVPVCAWMSIHCVASTGGIDHSPVEPNSTYDDDCSAFRSVP